MCRRGLRILPSQSSKKSDTWAVDPENYEIALNHLHSTKGYRPQDKEAEKQIADPHQSCRLRRHGIQIMPTVPQTPVALNATKQAISKNFKTYSLFFVCNPQWLDPAKTLG